MKKLLSLVLVLALACLPISTLAQPKQKLVEKAFSATGELFIMNMADVYVAAGALPPAGLQPADVCTVWNVEKTADGYNLVTAAHCVQLGGLADTVKAMTGHDIQFAISYDNPTRPVSDMVLLPAQVIKVGSEEDFESDVAEFHVKTNMRRDVLEIGDETILKAGDKVIDVSAPLGGDIKFMVEGYVSQPAIREKQLQGSAWFIMPGANPGSSGSAIISEKTGKVVSVLNVGAENAGGVSGVKASKIKEFLDSPVAPATPASTPASAPAASAPHFAYLPQRGHGSRGGSQHGSRGGDRGHADHRGPGSRGRDTIHRVRQQEIRTRGGHQEIFFDGYWFGCGFWPAWVFEENVYFDLGMDGNWYLFNANGDLSIRVVIVE